MKSTRIARLFIFAVLGVAFFGAVHAQTPPNIGDILRQTQPPPVPAKPAPALPSIDGSQPIEPPMAALSAGPKVDVREIQIVGNRVIDTNTLNTLVADGAGKSLTLAELEALALRITQHYRASGYFVARAYIPAQEIGDGVVRVRVVEGNYGQFVLKNQSLVRDETVQGMLDAVKDTDIVSLDTLERAMLIINDTPGVRVTRADVMPGQKVGTSDFAVDTAATARYTGFVMLDNYGSVYTGKNRLSFNIDANSPTGIGDRLSLSGLGTNGADLLNGRIGYSLPLTATGLRGEVAFSDTHYTLGDAYSALDAEGSARGFDATLTYPLRRIRAQTIELSLNVGYKRLLDEIRATDTRVPKKTTYGTAGISLRDERKIFGLDGLTRASAMFTTGHLDIRDSEAAALDAAGPETEGSYNKIILSLGRQTLLPARFNLLLQVKAQQALNNKNLDGSERMSVSGSDNVSAYPPGELLGDDATFARIELSHPLLSLDRMQSSWFVFSDYGEAKSADDSGNIPRRHLSDTGLGFNANYLGAILRVSWTHRLESSAPISEPYPRNKLLAQAGWVF